MKKRSPIYYGAGGCLLGILFMVIVVATTSLLGPELVPISRDAFQTIVTFGSLFLPLVLGLFGYHWAKDRQSEKE